jgi:hypothetical protein
MHWSLLSCGLIVLSAERRAGSERIPAEESLRRNGPIEDSSGQAAHQRFQTTEVRKLQVDGHSQFNLQREDSGVFRLRG